VLEIDAQVMLIKVSILLGNINMPRLTVMQNLDVEHGLVNGSVGKVIDFWTYERAEKALVPVAKNSENSPDREKRLEPDKILFDSGRLWPLVEFTNHRLVLCNATQFESQDAEGRLRAVREQVRILILDRMFK